MKRIAIIPARGGSKRIPDKNIRLFFGKPMIHYPIQAAMASNLFDVVMVSTDSPKIAGISRQCGAEVPFMRSPENSSDFAPLKDVVMEVLNEYAAKSITFDYFCCILPATPLLRHEKLAESYHLLVSGQSTSLIPVVRYAHPIQRAFRINAGGNLAMILPEHKLVRTQDLEPAYHDSGSFYWVKTESFMKESTFFTEKCIGWVLTESEAQDIDDEDDWKIAEIKYRKLSGI